MVIYKREKARESKIDGGRWRERGKGDRDVEGEIGREYKHFVIASVYPN